MELLPGRCRSISHWRLGYDDELRRKARKSGQGLPICRDVLNRTTNVNDQGSGKRSWNFLDDFHRQWWQDWHNPVADRSAHRGSFNKHIGELREIETSNLIQNTEQPSGCTAAEIKDSQRFVGKLGNDQRQNEIPTSLIV